MLDGTSSAAGSRFDRSCAVNEILPGRSLTVHRRFARLINALVNTF